MQILHSFHFFINFLLEVGDLEGKGVWREKVHGKVGQVMQTFSAKLKSI